MCSQLSTIDEASDLRQILACDVDQKEGGFDAMAFRKMLIRTGHRRNQLAASTKDLKRTGLCFAADQINDSVRIPNFFLKALGPVVNHRVCAEVAHEGDIIRGCGRDRLHTRATGQLNRIRSNVSCRPVNNYRLTCFELGLIEQRLPCGHGNDRNRGGFNVGSEVGLLETIAAEAKAYSA